MGRLEWLTSKESASDRAARLFEEGLRRFDDDRFQEAAEIFVEVVALRPDQYRHWRRPALALARLER